MYAPVHLAREEGMNLVCLDGELPPALDGLDFEILGRWRCGQKVSVMARELRTTPATIRLRMARAPFQAAQARIQRNFFDAIARGEFGAMAILKANLVGNVKGLLKLARTSVDERVQLQARLELIKMAGLQPPKPLAPERPEQLLDQMDPEELAHFAATNEIPKRLGDQVARMAATVLRARQAKTVEAEVVWEAAEGVETAKAEATARGELPDDDGPGWEQLPDETELEG